MTIKSKNIFQYAPTVTLNHEEIDSHPERVSNIKLVTNKYNKKGINFLSKTDDWKTFEKNNPAIAPFLKKKKYTQLISQKGNSNCGKNNSINNFKSRKRKTRKQTTLKYPGDFCCLNCLHSFETKNKLKYHKKVCKNKDFFGIEMPPEKDNILEFNQYIKLHKMLYFIYTDIGFLTKIIDG